VEQEQTHVAVEQIKTTIRVCLTFKSNYFDYKATANAECPTNPWRVQNTALFQRLDNFLERCHDILDLFQVPTSHATSHALVEEEGDGTRETDIKRTRDTERIVPFCFVRNILAAFAMFVGCAQN
jgi:hypothetical protein